MIPRKKLQVLLYVLRIYYVFGDQEPIKENLQILDTHNDTGLKINKLDTLNSKNRIETTLQTTEGTTEFTLAENTIPSKFQDELKTNRIDDSGKKKDLDKIESISLDDESQTISKKTRPANSIAFGVNINMVRVINTTSDSITFSWNVESHFVPLYRIEWINLDSSDYGHEESNLSIHTIKKLKPCSSYEIKVSEGFDDPAMEQIILFGATTPSVPSVVRNLTVEAGKSFLNISWIQPEENSKCVIEYPIEIVNTGNNTIHQRTANSTFLQITGLDSCAEYNIYVKAAGEAESSTVMNITATTERATPETVRNLTAKANETSINISWIPPEENSACVIKYSIEVVNTRNNTIHQRTTNSTFLIITDLDPCTGYNISVKAVGNTESSIGNNATVTTKIIKPGEARKLGALPLEKTSLKIYWHIPDIGATCVKKYRVTLHTVLPLGSSGTTKTDSTNKTEIIFENLFPCTSYSVQINVVDVENGDSDLARISSTPRTLSSPAPAPKKAKVPIATKDSITFFWNIGNNSNCTLDSVKVICNATGSDGLGYDPISNGSGSSSSVAIDKFYRHMVNVTVPNLSPYTSYDCQAKTLIDGEEESKGSTIINATTLEDVPSAPELKVTNVTDAEYTFDWIGPEIIPGTIRNLEISLSWKPLFPVPDFCNPKLSDATEIDGSLLNYMYKKGSPFSNYTARIRAKTGGGWGNFSEPVMFVSESGAPSVVNNLTCNHERNKNDSNVLNTILQWRLPCSLNGEIEFFNISVHGTRNRSEDHSFVQLFDIDKEVHKDDVFMKDLEGLRPAYTYTFTVSTKVENVTTLVPSTIFNIKYPARIPVQPDNEYVKMLTIDPQKAIRTTTSAAVLLPLFPITHGDIEYYAVMVSKMGYNKAISTSYELKDNNWPNSSCWQESMLQDFSIPYQATSPRWNPFPNYVIDYGHIKAVKFTLGEDIDCKELSVNTDSRLYCNGPLSPGTWYHVRMRAFTKSGYSDSATFTVKTNAELNVPIIIGIVFGIMIIGILTTLMLLVRRCSLQAVLRRFMHSDLPGSPVPTPFTRRKFICHCQQLADNPGKLSNEFQLLQTLSLDLQMPTNSACLQANRKKNRYSDILPYDFSRVKLDVIDNDPNTDYINASFITGYSGEDEYIACQGPKEETTYDFWRMIDQYDVKIIVMLTQLFEKGKEKCHQYFPVIRETFNYEKMSIRCTSELDFRTCTQRTMILEKNDKKRSIMHLHFKDWPDHDVPEDFDPMINFCQIVRRSITANKGFVVIHCSAGIGRTGTLIAIDMLLQSIRDNRKLDVFGTVYRLRRHRLNMVQRESQYAYIYNCIRQVLKNPYFLKNYKPPPVDPMHKNNKKKKDSANSSLGLVNSLETWRKDSISLSVDSMEPMYETSPSSSLEIPKTNGLRCSKSTSALNSKSLGTCVVKSSSQGYVTYESVKNSSSGSSNGSLNVSDLQGSRGSMYENVRPLFRSKSDQLLDKNTLSMYRSIKYETKQEPLERDTTL